MIYPYNLGKFRTYDRKIYAYIGRICWKIGEHGVDRSGYQIDGGDLYKVLNKPFQDLSPSLPISCTMK